MQPKVEQPKAGQPKTAVGVSLIDPAQTPLKQTQEAERIKIIWETVHTLSPDGSLEGYQEPAEKYLAQAKTNMSGWSLAAAEEDPPPPYIEVYSGDWGEVALMLSKLYGETYYVLNMANAWHPGGGYRHGAAAQEENIFRRTNAHFTITSEVMNFKTEEYHQKYIDMINGDSIEGVYLDKNIRFCFRGKENAGNEAETNGIGYEFLPAEDIFPFYELRAAALDCRGIIFNKDIARLRIQRQLDTLIENKAEYILLSAFGCGAFKNPPEIIAEIYKEELEKRKGCFKHVAFAIYNAGYDKNDNYSIFRGVLHEVDLTPVVENPIIKNLPVQNNTAPSSTLSPLSPCTISCKFIAPIGGPVEGTAHKLPKPVIDIKFATKELRDEWHSAFLNLAKQEGLLEEAEALFQTTNDEKEIRILYSVELKTMGTYRAKPCAGCGITELYRKVSINWGSEGLRNFFVNSLTLSEKEVVHFDSELRKTVTYFRPQALTLDDTLIIPNVEEGKDRSSLETSVNVNLVKNAKNFIPANNQSKSEKSENNCVLQ